MLTKENYTLPKRGNNGDIYHNQRISTDHWLTGENGHVFGIKFINKVSGNELFCSVIFAFLKTYPGRNTVLFYNLNILFI